MTELETNNKTFIPTDRQLQAVNLWQRGIFDEQIISERLGIPYFDVRKITTFLGDGILGKGAKCTRSRILYGMVHESWIPSYFNELPEDFPVQSTKRSLDNTDTEILLLHALGLELKGIADVMSTDKIMVPSTSVRARLTEIRYKLVGQHDDKFRHANRQQKIELGDTSKRPKVPYVLMSQWFYRSGILLTDPYDPDIYPELFFNLPVESQKELFYKPGGIRERCLDIPAPYHSAGLAPLPPAPGVIEIQISAPMVGTHPEEP